MQRIENDLAPAISLDGVWQFDAAGHTGEIVAPGCWEAQGYPKTLDGPVVYRRNVHIPQTWENLPIFAEFDAVSYAASIRCNGSLLGAHYGLWTPFAVPMSPAMQAGASNVIEVEVTKPSHALTGGAYPMRTTLAGFLPDVATTFGGIWQRARLRTVEAGFEALRVSADFDSRTVHVYGRVVSARPAMHAHVQVDVTYAGHLVQSQVFQPSTGNAAFDLHLPVADIQPWSP
ncbi:MAG: hypothetical protein R6W76_16230, partial [Caldilinea sp.]